MPVRGFGDARLRYESVDLPNAGEDALTLRVAAGAEVQFSSKTSFLIEAEGVADLLGEEDGLVPAPLVPDREVLELNRAQLSHDFGPARVIVGRQRLSFDDERFVGAVAFRQNEQTYDAARVTAAPVKGVTIDAAYVWQVNRFLSSAERDARFEGDSFLLNIGAATPLGQLTGYHYALDLDDGSPTPLSAVNSSATTGVSLAGRKYWNAIGLGWRAEYARQTDYADNPLDYSADYWRAAGSVEVEQATVTAGYEVLGEGGARAFQTPLGTNHAFQGAADLLVVTPNTGVRDAYLDGVWRIGSMGPFRNIAAGLRRHDFSSDIDGEDLGQEWNASLRAQIHGVAAILEYADYSADSFGVDTQKLWVTLRRTF